nr:MAG TPA: Site-specific DNA methylase [Caudoviricetes sp.]
MKPAWPYFGAKTRAAEKIWRLLGNPPVYIEPFCGTCAALLGRPGWRPGQRRGEIVNDADGLLVNTLRAIRYRPSIVLRHAGTQTSEIDMHARQAKLAQVDTGALRAWLEASPTNCDPVLAGWWIACACDAIGNPIPPGPWTVQDGHLADTGENSGIARSIPSVNRRSGIRAEDGRQRVYAIAERLSAVDILAGDWRRALTPSITSRRTTGLSDGGSPGILLDPPYTVGANLYAHGDDATSVQVEQWCLREAPDDWRIIVCGYAGDHPALEQAGWTVHQGGAAGVGYSHTAVRSRETLWASPACTSIAPMLC